jgi:DNA-binding XRE family transcriptional regulator
MANLNGVLRDEIARLARRELRADLDAIRKVSASYRSEIAALKRRIAAAESQLKRTSKVATKAAGASAGSEPEQAEDTKLRFRRDGFITLRKRLGLTAEATGKLLGVSGQSIYLWESGRTAPRGKHLVTIAQLRKLGKREVNALLEGME